MNQIFERHQTAVANIQAMGGAPDSAKQKAAAAALAEEDCRYMDELATSEKRGEPDV